MDAARLRAHAAAEKLLHRHLAEGARGAEIGHRERLLQRAAGGNDFRIHPRDRFLAQRTGIFCQYPAQHLGFALRTVYLVSLS